MSSDRVAVVTGGGSGMGRATALMLAAAGTTVAVIGRTAAPLEGTQALAGDASAIVARTCDVSDAGAVETLFDELARDLGRIDVLVCSHGIYQGGTGALDLPIETYERTMAVNVRGPLLCAQHAARAMVAGARGGRIVLLSSMNAVASQRGAIDYDTSKAAVNGLTRALAVDLAPFGITVNAIAPGWVRTPMSEDELEHLEGAGLVMNPLHAVGSPDDVARAAVFLSHPDNGFVTGTLVRVDGGQTAMLPTPWPADQQSIV